VFTNKYILLTLTFTDKLNLAPCEFMPPPHAFIDGVGLADSHGWSFWVGFLLREQDFCQFAPLH